MNKPQYAKQYDELRLILGDQLNSKHSWFTHSEPQSVLYVIAEMPQECQYVRHHEQKILAFFAAMTQFAQQLTQRGFAVLHLTLDDTQHTDSLQTLLFTVMQQYGCQRLRYQQPDEYRLSAQLSDVKVQCVEQGIDCYCDDSEHFMVAHDALGDYFSAAKQQRMETFYRKMRKQYNILMVGDKPLGERWNFDSENRKKLSKQAIAALPEPLLFSNDVRTIRERLVQHQVARFGRAQDQLLWPINTEQAEQLLDYFCRACLPQFGAFQDAMTCQGKDLYQDKQWSLYHARISFALNVKLLHPLAVIERAIAEYQHNSAINLAQIEGFVRQIIGWREFIRGIYWTHMPDYQHLNHFNARRDLPKWYWSGETKMRCLQHAINQSLDYAYAHHIQRLMVTGNFSLLTGIDPDQVDAWYLGIYIDAIQWVEMPNTRGMSQFADGGIVGSKPYAASGNYINKMSDYCKGCHYDVKQKIGETACPLNSLYWQFMIQHRDSLAKNPRIGMVYRNWDKQDDAQQAEILAHAQQLLSRLDTL